MVFVATFMPGCGEATIGESRVLEACIPDCAGKECGDDGCSGSCGDCAGGELCNGLATCYDPSNCVPDCAEGSIECGDDGCGGSCGMCSGGDTCNNISGQCVSPVGLVWKDSIQSGSGKYGFDTIACEFPIDTGTDCADGNGANLHRVDNPDGGGYAMRHFGELGRDGSRAQLGIWSFRNSAFGDLVTSGQPVYVAQEWYFPKAISAGGDPYPWLSLWDWHSTGAGGSPRWHTAPGLMLEQDGSMRVFWAWGGDLQQINGESNQASAVSLPVGEWFDIEMKYEWTTSKNATISLWINGELALEQSGVQTAQPVHENVEIYIKLYGADNGRTPWSPDPAVKYTRNVRISGERIWR